MKFYIASTFNNWAAADAVADRLLALGWEQTFRWSLYHPENPARQVLGDLDLQLIGLQEVAAVYKADVVIALAPCGFGSHIEMGLALAYAKPLLVVGEEGSFDMSNPFYHHPRVTRVASSHESIDWEGLLVPLARLLAAGSVPAEVR